MSNMKKIIGLVLFLSVSGCIKVPPPKMGASLNGAPPPTQAQVSSCESLRSAHNTWTTIGAIAGGVAGASGPADAVISNKTAQEAIGMGVGVTGVLALVATTVAGLKANEYTQDNCANILSLAGVATP
jgi:hypothetical protein